MITHKRFVRNSEGKNPTLRGGGGSGDVGMARQIMVGVRRAGLPLKLDEITPGDGNCFFHAAFAQCQRPSLAEELLGEPAIRNNHDLRLKISRFARRSRLPIIQRFMSLFQESHPTESWDAFWKNMENDRVWADAIVLQVAAWFFHHDIHVVMASATEKRPLCTFSGSWVTDGAPCDKTPLLLGYLNDLHYQSLLHEEDDLFRPETFQPMSFMDTINVFVQGLQIGEHKRKQDEKDKTGEEIPRKKRKDKEGGTDEGQWDFNFLWSGKQLSIKPLSENGWECPFCESEQKRIMGHIKSKHLGAAYLELFKDIEMDFRKHAVNKNKKKCREKMIKQNPELAKERHREVDKKSRDKRINENPELAREKHREVDKKCRDKRMNENPELVRERHREVDRIHKSSINAAIKNFYKEILYGPIFPCECCVGLYARHQVVELDKPCQAQVRKHADEAKIRDYNNKVQQVINCIQI